MMLEAWRKRAGTDFAPALAGMLSTQVAAAAVLAAVPVLAPEIAPEAAVDASLVGVYSSLMFLAAMMVSAAAGGLIARLGGVGTNQVALVAAGLALLLSTGASVALLAVAAVLVGCAYGPNTPSGSQVLARVTPPHRRGLAFSLKQSGAPLGGMLAGFALPFIVDLAGWRAAIAFTTAVALAVALAMEPLRRRVDRAPGAGLAGPAPSPLAAMGVVLADPALRRATVGGVAMMIVHSWYQVFLVTYLVERVELALAAAGALYASLQISAAVSRVALGWLADRISQARRVLAAIALTATLATVALAAFEPGWPLPAMWLVCVVAGVGSSGWYGVFLAEVARRGPPEGAGLATGGALFFVYAGHVGGPIAITGLVAASGSYLPAFAAVALLGAVAAASFARA